MGYVVTHKLDKIRDVGFSTFHRFMFFDPPDDLQSRVFGRMLALVQEERDGANIDGSLMRSAVDMLRSLCSLSPSWPGFSNTPL